MIRSRDRQTTDTSSYPFAILSILVLLSPASSTLPLPDFLGLLALVDALLVDAEAQAPHQGQYHHHDGPYRPHGHWGAEMRGREGDTS